MNLSTKIVCLLLLPLASTWFHIVPPQASEGSIIGPYLQEVGRSEVMVKWVCQREEECTLKYGPGESLSQTMRCKPAVTLKDGKNEFLFEARLTGLQSGTKYAYSVTAAGKEVKGSFRTAPERAEKFTFIYYGDSRSNPDAHRKVTACFVQHDPAFVLHSGDMVDDGGYMQWKPMFFDPLAGVTDRIPLWPARGNHEGDGKTYSELLSSGKKELWYSFDWGNAHFVVLDSSHWRYEDQKPLEKTMLAWCEKDLAASKAPWKIVCYHEPSYDLGHRASDWGRKDLLPILRKGGVDLTLTGHAHGYERFHPMVTVGENDAHPITHVVSAGGGASIDSGKLPEVPHLAAQCRQYHYILFTIDGETMDARVLVPGGKEADAFRLTKKDGAFGAAFLASALSEEEFGKPGPVSHPLKDTAEMNDLLAQAVGAEGRKEFGKAIALYDRVAAMAAEKAVPPTVENAIKHGRDLSAEGAKGLDAALALAKERRFAEAAGSFDKLAVAYSGSEVGAKALEEAKKLAVDPEFNAARKLAEAGKLMEAKEYVRAKALYDEVMKMAGTESAKVAAAELEKLAQNGEAQAVMNTGQAEKDCRAWLGMARNFAANGMNEQARQYLDRIISRYPDTKWAEEAKAVRRGL